MEGIIWYKKQIVKREIKHKLMETISKDELVLISVSRVERNTKLNWEHSKEFEYEGAMYDVVFEEIYNDNINFWCWPDSEESSLNRLLQNLAHEKKQSHESEFLKLFESLIFTIPVSNLSMQTIKNKATYKYFLNLNYNSRKQTPLTPPPCNRV